MFNSFRRRLPEISIFHNPASPQSQKALNMLRGAISAPYPPPSSNSSASGSSSSTSTSTSPNANTPLAFNLEVVESPPNKDQLSTILSYMPSKATNPALLFLSAHPAASEAVSGGGGLDAIAKVGQEHPQALRWPIVVDWSGGKASVGDVEGVKSILEELRKKRDGESPSEDQVDQPKGWFS